MLDKISIVLKDVIIYLFPGVLILSCLIKLTGNSFETLGISNNINIALIGLAFSFIFGFIVSQLQIILFWKCIKIRYRTLNDCKFNESVKSIVIEKIIKVFNFPVSTNHDDLKDDEKITELCGAYVKSHCSYEAYSQIERDGYLSSFAISLFIPTVLSCIILFKESSFYNLNFWLVIFISTLLLVFLIWLIYRISINFKLGHTVRIYYYFLSIA